MSSAEDTYKNPCPSIAQKSFSVANHAGKILISEWFSNHYRIGGEKGWWNWQGCRNFLFADGGVHFLQATEIQPARDGLPNRKSSVSGRTYIW